MIFIEEKTNKKLDENKIKSEVADIAKKYNCEVDQETLKIVLYKTNGTCPCRPLEEVNCPCDDAFDEIKKYGQCLCGLLKRY